MHIDHSDPRHRVGIRLVGLARRWRQALDVRLSSLGLSDATWAPLVQLHELGDGISQNELATALAIDSSTLVRLLDALVEQALIEKRPHASDRRVRLLYLTAAGRQTVLSLRQRLKLIESELLADVDPDDVQAMLRAFDGIELRIAAASGKSA